MKYQDFLNAQFLTEMFNLKSAPGYEFEVTAKEDMPAMFALAWQATFTADNNVEYAFRVFRAREYGKNSRRLVFMRRKSKNLSQNITIDHGTFKKVIVTFLRCYEAYKDSADGQKCSSVAISMQPGVVKHAGLFMRAVKRAFRTDKRKQLNLVGVNEEGLKGNVELMMQVTMSPYPYWGGKDYDSVAFTTNPTYQQLAGIKDSTHLPIADIDDNGTDPVVAAPDKNVNGSSKKEKHFSISRDNIEYMFDENVGGADAESFVDLFSGIMKGGNEVILKNGQGGAKVLAIYVHSDLKHFTVLMQDHNGQSMPPFTGTPKEFFDSHAVISFSPVPTEAKPKGIDVDLGIRYVDKTRSQASQAMNDFVSRVGSKVHAKTISGATIVRIEKVEFFSDDSIRVDFVDSYIKGKKVSPDSEKYNDIEDFFAAWIMISPEEYNELTSPVDHKGLDIDLAGIKIIDKTTNEIHDVVRGFFDRFGSKVHVKSIISGSVAKISRVEFFGPNDHRVQVSIVDRYNDGQEMSDYTEMYSSSNEFFSFWEPIDSATYNKQISGSTTTNDNDKYEPGKVSVDYTKPVAKVDTSFYSSINAKPMEIGPVKIEFDGVSTIEVVDKIQEISEFFGTLPAEKVQEIAYKMATEIESRRIDYFRKMTLELNNAGLLMQPTGDPRESAIELYTGSSFRRINTALRDNPPEDKVSPKIRELIDEIDSLFAEKGQRLPGDISVFRGQSIRQEDISALNNGEAYELPSYTSTSLNPRIGYQFTETASMTPDLIAGTARRKVTGTYREEQFNSRQGSKIFMDINGLDNTLSLMIEKLSSFAKESEVLLNRGTFLKTRGNSKVVRVAERYGNPIEGVYYVKATCVRGQAEGIKSFHRFLMEQESGVDGMTAQDNMNMLLAFLVDRIESTQE